MYKVLLVNDGEAQAGRFRGLLLQAGCDVLDELPPTVQAAQQVQRLQPDMVLVDTHSPSAQMLEQIERVHQDAPRPIVMVSEDAEPAAVRAAIRAGVSAYVREGMDARALAAVLTEAQARFEAEQALRLQLRVAETRLDERKLVERAKGLLMQLRGLAEADAYHAMRKMAMDRNIRLVDVANKLLAMNELLA